MIVSFCRATSLRSQSQNKRQQGIVMVMTAVAMVAIIAMTGLALDGGHVLLTKTRLQNMVDSAALSGAKTLDQTNDIPQAIAAVSDAFTRNANFLGNHEIAAALSAGAISVTKEFSSTLDPFVSGSVPARYVRVAVANLALSPWLIQVIGFNSKRTSASAVAGPSPTLSSNICDIAPMMICGEENDPLDDSEMYGYDVSDAFVLKYAANQEGELGAGNFQLIQVGDQSGGAGIRDGLAGAYESGNCLSKGEYVETEPGNTVGPVVQGLNTRFGMYAGGGKKYEEDYPGDFVGDPDVHVPNPPLEMSETGTPIFPDNSSYQYPSADIDNYTYTEYDAGYAAFNSADAIESKQYHRRILTVPVGECSGEINGKSDVKVFGFTCIYLIQPVKQQGLIAHVYGQMVNDCDTEGTFSIEPVTGPEPTKIILYKDPNNLDA